MTLTTDPCYLDPVNCLVLSDRWIPLELLSDNSSDCEENNQAQPTPASRVAAADITAVTMYNETMAQDIAPPMANPRRHTVDTMATPARAVYADASAPAMMSAEAKLLTEEVGKRQAELIQMEHKCSVLTYSLMPKQKWCSSLKKQTEIATHDAATQIQVTASDKETQTPRKRVSVKASEGLKTKAKLEQICALEHSRPVEAAAAFAQSTAHVRDVSKIWNN